MKGIGIISVAIGHIYSNRIVFNWLYSFHMPLFFFASGWLYKEKTILVDIKRKIQTIVVPYFSFVFLLLLYWRVVERRFRNSADIDLLNSIFGLFYGSYNSLEFNVHLWFLPCFFLTVVLFNILVNQGGINLAYIVVILMSLIYIVIPMPELFWGFNRVFKYMAFYAMGVFLAQKGVKAIDRQLGVGIAAIVLLVLNFFLSYNNLTYGYLWFIAAYIGVASIVLFSQIINENRILQYFGRISLIVLCIHGPVYRIVVKIISIMLCVSTVKVRENYFLAMLVVVITMAVCSAVYEVIIRIAPWMVGKKNNIKSKF